MSTFDIVAAQREYTKELVRKALVFGHQAGANGEPAADLDERFDAMIREQEIAPY